MLIDLAIAAVQIDMPISATHQLFNQVAPTYDATYVLSHLTKKFAYVQDKILSIRIAEFLKFMFLRSKYQKGFIPLIGEVDDIWHEFILQTHEYEKFCQALPSGKFIHHNSVHLEDFSKDKSKHEVVQDLMNWLPHYYHHFGIFDEEAAQYWLIINFLQIELKLTLDQINQVAKEAAQKLYA